MKRFIGIVAAVVMVLLLASPALAASLGISPSHTELEVPADGSAVANFQVHYFSGDVQVSLVDIPLRVEPETIHVEALSEPVDIELTIYGDESLGSQVYDGYVRFLGMSGEMVAVAVEVKAKVTNIVAGQPVPQEPTEQIRTTPSPEEAPAPSPTEATPGEEAPPQTPATTEFPLIPIAGIAAGVVIVVTLILVVARRKSY